MTSQKQKILDILSDGNFHCTNEFYSSYIADPRTRIAELKKQGYILLWRWCKAHAHNKSKEWQLLGKGAKIAPNSDTPPKPRVLEQNHAMRQFPPKTRPQNHLFEVSNSHND